MSDWPPYVRIFRTLLEQHNEKQPKFNPNKFPQKEPAKSPLGIVHRTEATIRTIMTQRKSPSGTRARKENPDEARPIDYEHIFHAASELPEFETQQTKTKENTKTITDADSTNQKGFSKQAKPPTTKPNKSPKGFRW